MTNISQILSECLMHSQGYNRIQSPFTVNGQSFGFVTAPSGKIYSRMAINLPFTINGISYPVARKGCRPQNIQRAQFSFPGETRYLIRFDDNEVRLCSYVYPSDTPVGNRTGDIIASSDLGIRYLYLLLQGGGGGGAGSSTAVSGAGAGAGALSIACISLEYVWQITCGVAGAGGGNSSNGQNGGNTIASANGISIVAGGGEGGQYDQRGGNGGTVIGAENEFCHIILSVNGAPGSNVNGKGNAFNAVSSENYADNGENFSISFSEVERAWDAIGFHGGSGASSAFGKGGKGEGLSNNGGNAESYGAGGGGAGSTPARIGGNGGAGLIRIYY